MDATPRRPAGHFLFSGAVLAVVCVAMARLPESFIAVFERSRPLNDAQGGWAYRFLVAASVAQAAYGGFVVLRVETIRRARRQDPKIAAMPRDRILTTVARNAAFMVSLTLVYGLAAFWITGERGGFWLFPLLAIAQLAWYYRQVGQIASWLVFQPDVERTEGPAHVWPREPPDYCPPLARGLTLRS
ncbi:MAG: hypothetical protein ACRDJJ_02775 [Actinomycetota bacterium]